MRFTLLAAAALIFLAVGATAETADDFYARAKTAFDAGDLASADRHLQGRLKLLEAAGESRPVWDAYYELAILYLEMSRADDAVGMVHKMLAQQSAVEGADSEGVSFNLKNFVEIELHSRGLYEAADDLIIRAVLGDNPIISTDNPGLEGVLSAMAYGLDQLGRYDAAAAIRKRILAARGPAETKPTPDATVETAKQLVDQGMVQLFSQNLDAAERSFRTALAIQERLLGPTHMEVAETTQKIAQLILDRVGRAVEAEQMMRDLLARLETAPEAEALTIAITAATLAEMLEQHGRIQEADQLRDRADQAIQGPAKSRLPKVVPPGPAGPNAPADDAWLEAERARLDGFAAALPDDARRALAAANERPSAATVAVLRRAALSLAIDRDPSPETRHIRDDQVRLLYWRVVELWEGLPGSANKDIARAWDALAWRYRRIERYDVVLAFQRRAMDTLHARGAVDDTLLAQALDQLLATGHKVGRRDAALEGRLDDLLARQTARLGETHPLVARTRLAIGKQHRRRMRDTDADRALRRALESLDHSAAADYPDLIDGLGQLSAYYQEREAAAAEEPALRAALDRARGAFPAAHPDLRKPLGNLKRLYFDGGRFGQAAALEIEIADLKQFSRFGGDLTDQDTSERITYLEDAAQEYVDNWDLNADYLFPQIDTYDEVNLLDAGDVLPSAARYLAALALLRHATGLRSEEYFDRIAKMRNAEDRPALRRELVDQVFKQLSLAADYVRAAGGDQAAVVGESFELAQLASINAAGEAVARMGARFARGDDALARLIRRRQDLLQAIADAEDRLMEGMSDPESGKTADPEKISERRARLAAVTARLENQFPRYAELTTPHPVGLDVIQPLLRPDEALLVLLPYRHRSYVWVVRRHTARMYTAAVTRGALLEAVGELRIGLDLSRLGDPTQLPEFDTGLAHDLYRALIAPAEPSLDGVRHLLVVPGGALNSLPLGVLVTEAPQAPITDFAGYQAVPWLARRYAMTVLPSVSSLRALRIFAARTRASKPFIGFGDPVLDGRPGGKRGVAFAALFRGGIADVDTVRRLPRLPETALELATIADALGAAPDATFLGARATETAVKGMDLSDARVVYFATHALVAGELGALQEPALVLTPPERASDADDGLLTASEIARLRLNADWVVLSACNTAAGEGPDAAGLSGLAKAFFYAGARSLLVSHWPVSSVATVALTTAMFEAAARHPEIGHAEALRRAMLAMLDSTETPQYRHPAFWAPFVVVGEGGAVDRDGASVSAESGAD